MARLAGKVALITGAGSGIGREASLLFAREGAAVVAVDRDKDSAEATVALVRSALSRSWVERSVRMPPQEPEGRGEAVAVTADVAVAADCEAMVAAAEQAYGRLDVLFNNAGVMLGADDDALATDEATWDTTMAVNAKGVFLGCKYGIPALRRAGGGSIINTASFVAKVGAATSQVAYTASKGAVLAFTRELAVIHAREGIRVNALCPGPLRTELLMKFLDTEEKRQRRLVHVPMGRFGEAAEIAKAALFLASDDASFMTGAEMLVDGGLTAAYVTPE
jgi:NAD(P)-dependent dehydrogenase (short-subunit alcohol dehydrogenase family)